MPVCNIEAPNVEALAKELDVLAIGGRDDAANGPAFVAAHGLKTPTVLFDEAMASWRSTTRSSASRARSCSTAMVANSSRWSGPLDNAEVLAAARAL